MPSMAVQDKDTGLHRKVLIIIIIMQSYDYDSVDYAIPVAYICRLISMETVLSQWFNVNISLLHSLSFLVSFSHNSEPLSLCVHYLVISISHQLFWFLNPGIDTIIIITIIIFNPCCKA